ncbi:unnamed protein product, partial [Mesorhabditis belari]|uniref:TAF6 C-terminal HEAT repeat domain-containing protein n=1 Tax=Mesorhabditis belari TaxID=2138241 RepID=A0AAF3EYI7_9BILA
MEIPSRDERQIDQPSTSSLVSDFDSIWLETILSDQRVHVGTRFENDVLEETSQLIKTRLRSVVSMAKVFAIHARRSQLTVEDFSLVRGNEGDQEPLGRKQKWNAPLSSGLVFPSNDTQINPSYCVDLLSHFQSPGIKLPSKLQLKRHWLVIEGIQPCIQDNPTIEKTCVFRSPEEISESKNSLTLEETNRSLDTIYHMGATKYLLPTPNGLLELSQSSSSLKEPTSHLKSLPWIPALFKSIETSPVKDDRERANESGKSSYTKTQLVNHPPASQKVLYHLILSMLNGDDEDEQKVLQILATSTGLQLLIPRLIVYISEGTTRLLRVAEAIIANRSNDLSKMLCDLMPAMISCILASRLSDDLLNEEHWALRQVSANILVDLCQKYEENDNLTRLTHLLGDQWKNSNDVPLPTLYGSLYTLSLLGTQTMSQLCLPYLETLSKRFDHITNNSMDETEINQAKTLQKMIVTVFSQWVIEHSPTTLTTITEFISTFGKFGQEIYETTSDANVHLNLIKPRYKFSVIIQEYTSLSSKTIGERE